jgi:uncharacterized protein Smg (DUF494 family)
VKTLNPDNMDIKDIKETLKMLSRLANKQHDLIMALQERILKLELTVFSSGT